MNQIVKLFGIALILLSLLLGGCAAKPTLPTAAEPREDSQESRPSALLRKTEDMGQSYLDSFVFLGESTTYHLKNRGVLTGGKETKQVWGPDGGTVNLDADIGSLQIRYPETGELLPLSEALKRKKPKRLLLCFGLNGAPAKLKRGKESFKSCYRVLLDAVKKASPDTRIILQSAFPVAENMDMSAYSLTLDGLNDAIGVLFEYGRNSAR